jgi:hypothetical protein
MVLHIVFTGTHVVLSKKNYTQWIQIQGDFSDYKASLGPWGVDEIIDYLNIEYGNLLPSAYLQVHEFINSNEIIKVVLRA